MVVAVASLGLASAPFAGAEGTSPVVNDCVTDRSETRPSNLLLACGDGGLSVRDITWSSWGPDTAEGEGTEYRRVCEPSCAAGHTASVATHITLRTPQDGHFTEAVITDPNGNPETWPVGPLRH
ncbi:hypothetical protein KP696_33415 [Nocardia seriolae]|uniref:Secreted protein n=1 Tax=Nocardia seriolae TaxID=37332 RepID=A0ABC9YYV4_9NOCA|nr:hypothetical protein [Nocardia seriolae]APA99120.1 hypothetical protein NS506_05074 [Nocardia seriolae]MTJ73794.1 hypothetical protein [Nocardia seriolae]MTJ88725.1 hypothetical protein [Nocardia seriolae]MTK32704.1 hypothetical protein [Nocardia seriolae]MTK49295.1 hypothetical protein [Nocardia seriolae]